MDLATAATYWLETSGPTKCPTMHRTAPTTEDPAPNVRRAGDEKLVKLRGRAGRRHWSALISTAFASLDRGRKDFIDLSSDIGWCDCGQVTKPFPALIK